MKKLAVVVTLITISFLVVLSAVFVFVSNPIKAEDVLTVNIYLDSYDTNTFNTENLKIITEKNEIEEIIEIMNLNKWTIRLYKNADEDLAYNPSGYVEFVLKNKKVKRFEFFENKKGFSYMNKQQRYFYLTYKNDSFQALMDKYAK